MILERLGCVRPIVQAPMAGGGDTPALVAAVGEAGGIGFIGAGYLGPEAILEAARAVRQRTARPFGINLFAPLAVPSGVMTIAAVERIAPYYAELGLPPPPLPAATSLPFDEQLAAVLESGAAAFSFTFGIPPAAAIEAAKSHRLIVLGTATTVEEATELERAGVDVVVTQGSEAGGHRGTFAGTFAASMIGTMALVPQVVDAVSIPVIASGGIMDGRGVAAALALGAAAVQMGTAFLTCEEAGIPEAYKRAILAAREDQTRLTRAFSGRAARGIVNRFMDETETAPDAILPFPMQNALTRPLRTAAAKLGRAEFLNLWAGQGVRLARRTSARELVERVSAESDAIVGRLASRGARGARGD